MSDVFYLLDKENNEFREENAALKKINLELSGEHGDGDRCPFCGDAIGEGSKG